MSARCTLILVVSLAASLALAPTGAAATAAWGQADAIAHGCSLADTTLALLATTQGDGTWTFHTLFLVAGQPVPPCAVAGASIALQGPWDPATGGCIEGKDESQLCLYDPSQAGGGATTYKLFLDYRGGRLEGSVTLSFATL